MSVCVYVCVYAGTHTHAHKGMRSGCACVASFVAHCAAARAEGTEERGISIFASLCLFLWFRFSLASSLLLSAPLSLSPAAFTRYKHRCLSPVFTTATERNRRLGRPRTKSAKSQNTCSPFSLRFFSFLRLFRRPWPTIPPGRLCNRATAAVWSEQSPAGSSGISALLSSSLSLSLSLSPFVHCCAVPDARGLLAGGAVLHGGAVLCVRHGGGGGVNRAQLDDFVRAEVGAIEVECF